MASSSSSKGSFLPGNGLWPCNQMMVQQFEALKRAVPMSDEAAASLIIAGALKSCVDVNVSSAIDVNTFNCN